MTTLRVGIASYEKMKERTRAIARGEFKLGPRDPKVWFPSTESMARILRLQKLRPAECDSQDSPQSLTELAEATGRKKPNLSRTIKTMQRYGLVEVKQQKNGRLAPKVAYKRVELTMELGAR